MAFAYFEHDKWNAIEDDFTLDGASYTMADLAVTSIDDLAELGIIVIEERSEGPAGPRVSRRLEDEDGKPVWIYTTEALPVPPSPEELEAINALLAKKQVIENRIQQAFNRGYLVDPVKYPDFVGERLQCRDDSDRTNWLVAEKEYVKAVNAGAGAVKSAEFRVMSNKTIKATFDDAVSILSDLTAWGFIIMKRGWALKDALAAGDEYDLEAGWPA